MQINNNNNLEARFRELIIPAQEIRETIKSIRRWERFTAARDAISRQILEFYQKRRFKEIVSVGCGSLNYKIDVIDLMGRNQSIFKTAHRASVLKTFCLANIGNLITDLAFVNYTEKRRKATGLFKPLTDAFCDNIMLIKILGKDCLQPLSTSLVKKEICGANNSFLRTFFCKYKLSKHGVKAKIPTILSPLENDKYIKLYENKFPDGIVKLPYKIELADSVLSEILEDLPGILKELRKHDFYLTDLDITQDFTGIFNKREMESYLCKNFSFTKKKGKDAGNCIIVDNDKTVGLNCLTWLNKNTRTKIYNKFVCQMTSPGVNKDIGNHIINFINCPDKRLKCTFENPSAQKHGITRLESTIYADKYCEDYQDPIKSAINVIDSAKILFLKAPFYSVSLSEQWTKICNSLKSSCCFVYDDILFYSLWGDSLTKKLTGYKIVLPPELEKKEKIKDFIVSAYSFNLLPINYVEIQKQADKQLLVKHTAYKKMGKTYFSYPNSLFSTVSVIPEKMALVDTSVCKPYFMDKKLSLKNKLKIYNTQQIFPPQKCNVNGIKKLEEILETKSILERREEFLSNTGNLDLSGAIKALELKNRRSELYKKFYENLVCKNWKEIPLNSKLEVFAFAVNTESKYPIVSIYCRHYSTSNYNIYFVKGSFKNKLVKFHSTAIEKKFVKLEYNGKFDFLYTPTEEPFVTIVTGDYKYFKGYKYTDVTVISDYIELIDENVKALEKMEDILKSVVMGKFPEKVNTSKCRKLEELDLGEYIVNSIEKRIYRSKTRYVFTLENIIGEFISNPFMQQAIEEKGENLNLNFKFKIKADIIRLSKNKKRYRVIFVAQ